MSAVAAAAVDACRPRAEEKGIALALEVSSHAPVLADPAAMQSVFANLVDNAIKYTADGGHVAVRVKEEGRQVAIAIRDDGIGMTGEEAGKIFDEFYRVRNDFTSKVPGTGLGLTLVRRLVEMHQGTVEVASEPGKGSTFTVRLPKDAAAA